MKEFYGMPLIAAASAMFMLTACDDSSSASDDAVSSSSITTVASSSSEITVVSSSSEDAVVSSSSSEIAPAVEMSSSSETAEISSSSEIASSSSAMPINPLGQTLLRVPEGGAFIWAASTDADLLWYYRVETGLDDGSESSGNWLVLDDSPDGGKSSIVWPVPKCDDDFDDYLDVYIDFCGGLCGNFALRKGTLTYNPFVGLGFNVAGEDDVGNGVAADASAWGGLCVAYISTENALLQLGLSTTFANPETDSPAAELPKSAEGTVVCVPWSKFTKSLNGETSISAEDASKNLVSVRFVIQGEDGAEGKFNLMSIGSYVEQ